MYTFEEVFVDDTRNGTKLKSDEYCLEGRHVIIDQGQNNIAGYTNWEEGLYIDVPAIIFGDHTRVVKYVDRPFFLGADGVKVLKCKLEGANYKYLYYMLKNVRLPDTGYNRHFKWLKEIEFSYPQKNTQDAVVIILDKVQGIINLREQEIKEIDNLIKSRFVEMFGEPVTNPKKLQMVALGELSELITKGASPNWQGFSYTDDSTKTLFVTSENVREGYIDISSPKYIEDEFNKKQKRSVLHKGDFLINIVGASIGRVAQFDLNCKANINQAVSLVRINDVRVLDKYLLVYLNSDKAQQMYNLMKSDTGRANLSLQDISTLSILLPPIEEQRKFELFVDHIDKLKFLHKQTLSILHHRRFMDVKF